MVTPDFICIRGDPHQGMFKKSNFRISSWHLACLCRHHFTLLYFLNFQNRFSSLFFTIFWLTPSLPLVRKRVSLIQYNTEWWFFSPYFLRKLTIRDTARRIFCLFIDGFWSNKKHFVRNKNSYNLSVLVFLYMD